jgi:alkaline phosphatase D
VNDHTTNLLDAFKLYNANANYGSRDSDQNHYDFRYGDAAFFVMDTCHFPSSVLNDSLDSRTLLGTKQLAALYGWLSEVIFLQLLIFYHMF